jgi:uncharacterized Tic20 family protein
MNQLLPVKIRLVAACCHLSGLSWIAIFYSISSDRSKLYPLSEIVNFISTLAPILFFVPLIIWLFAKNIHDFIDRSGRKALNYHCSMLLYCTCLLFVMGISCGVAVIFGAGNIGNNNFSRKGNAPEVEIFSSIFLGLFWIASNPQYLFIIHGMNVSIAAFFTLQGKVFFYPLAIPFFRDPIP